MSRYSFWVVGVVCLLAGCQKIDKSLEWEDDRNPHFRKARHHMELRDYRSAIKSYENALQANPNVAMAHYELGLLYKEKDQDFVSSMYHFQKFLQLRPESDKRETARAYLESSKIGFAALLPNSPIQNAEEFAKLQSDNHVLRLQNEEAQKKLLDLQSELKTAQQTLAQLRASPSPEPATPSSPPVAVTPPASAPVSIQPPPTTPKPTVMATTAEKRTYTIQPRDNLWRISSKFYPGDIKNGIEKIIAANPDVLTEGKPLKIGQVIVIPQ